MEVKQEPIYRRICIECHRPALTFDRDNKPMCAEHATVFVGAVKAKVTDEETW